jgi:hypothetical protein
VAVAVPDPACVEVRARGAEAPARAGHITAQVRPARPSEQGHLTAHKRKSAAAVLGVQVVAGAPARVDAVGGEAGVVALDDSLG